MLSHGQRQDLEEIARIASSQGPTARIVALLVTDGGASVTLVGHAADVRLLPLSLRQAIEAAVRGSGS